LDYLLKTITLTFPLYYWILKFYKCPYKERYIAGFAKCSTKSLSKLLTTVLSTDKDGLQTYCYTAYSRNGNNQMWILKNSNDLVESFSSQSLSVISFIKTFDFSTLYTTIPHPKFKSRLKDLVTNSCRAKSGKRRYSYIVVHGLNAYFDNNHTNRKTNSLIVNIFIEFGG